MLLIRGTATVTGSVLATKPPAESPTESSHAVKIFKAGDIGDIRSGVQPGFKLVGLVLGNCALLYQLVEIIVQGGIPHFLLGLREGFSQFLGIDGYTGILLVNAGNFIEQSGKLGGVVRRASTLVVRLGNGYTSQRSSE